MEGMEQLIQRLKARVEYLEKFSHLPWAMKPKYLAHVLFMIPKEIPSEAW